LDFFLWGYVKNIVYHVKINVKAGIGEAVAMVTPTCFKQRGTRLIIIWIFVVPPLEPGMKFIEKVMCMYSEKTMTVSLVIT
jgi:hypothetical protein